MKKLLRTCFSIAALLVFTACSFQIPKKVSVKTNAEYNFSIGDINKSFKDEMDTASVFKDVETDNSRVYDYFPKKKDPKTQEYLMRLPISEIPIDIDSYFRNSNIAAEIEGMSFTKSVNIPQINIKYNDEIDDSAVNSTVNSFLTITGNTGVGQMHFASEFNSISYDRGYFTISCPEIEEGTTVTISNPDDSRTATFYSGVAKIQIDSFTIYKDDTYLSFSGTSGFRYDGKISSDSDVNYATGITLAEPTEIPLSLTMSIADGISSFESCVVDEGYLDMSIIFPSSWTGIDFTYGVDFSGALNFNEPETEGPAKRIDLHGKTITKGDTTINAKLKMTFDNSSIYFNRNTKMSVASNISRFSNISVTASDITTSTGKSEEFSDSMINSVKEIMLKSSGLKGTYTNTFPAGNEILLKADSVFFGIDGKTTNLASETANGNFELKSPADTKKLNKIVETPVDENEYNEWDFSVQIKLPGATASNPNLINVKNVAPNENYEISMIIDTDVDWEYTIINAADSVQKKTQSIGMNVNQIFENLSSAIGIDVNGKMTITSLPLYIMAEKPDIKNENGTGGVFDDAKFYGTVDLFYGKKVGSDITKILDENNNPYEEHLLSPSDENSGVMNFVNAPDFTTEVGVLISDLDNIQHSIEKDLKPLLENTKDAEPGQFYINYDVCFSNGTNNGEIKITKAMFDQRENESTSVSLYALLVIPLKFKVVDNEDIIFGLSTLMGADGGTDFFGREEASSSDEIENYFDIIRSCSMIYTTSVVPFYSSPDMKFVFDITNSGTLKKYNLGSGEIKIMGDELNSMFSSFPLVPVADIEISRGSVFSLARNPELKMNLNVRIITDGVFTIGGDK